MKLTQLFSIQILVALAGVAPGAFLLANSLQVNANWLRVFSVE